MLLIKRKLVWKGLALSYFVIPNLIFLGVWLKWFIAIPILLIISNWLKKEFQTNECGKIEWHNADTFMLLIILVWIALAGVGGFTYQNGDWQKHNAVLSDLTFRPWPVIYSAKETGNNDFLLIYYIAFYLPAAFIGKIFGNIYITNICLFLWAYFGVLCVYVIIKEMFTRQAWLAMLALIFFSGMDLFGFQNVYPEVPIKWGMHLEAWANSKAIMQFSSFTTQMFWVPQHAIVGWLATLLIIQNRSNYTMVFMIWVMSMLYSPFVFVGLFPFVVYLSVKKILQFGVKIVVNINIIGACLVALAVGFYFISNTNDTMSMRLTSLWEADDNANAWQMYRLFEVLEIVLLATLAGSHYIFNKNKNAVWLLIAVATLLTLPVFKYGIYNDLCMRASIPSLVILWLFAVDLLFSTQKNRAIKYCVVFLLMVGAITPLMEIVRSVEHAGKRGNMEMSTLLEMEPMFREQYIDYRASDNWFYINIMNRQVRGKNEKNIRGINRFINSDNE